MKHTVILEGLVMIRKRLVFVLTLLVIILCVVLINVFVNKTEEIGFIYNNAELRNEYIAQLEVNTQSLSQTNALFDDDKFIVYDANQSGISVLVSEESARVFLEKLQDENLNAQAVVGSDLNVVRLVYGSFLFEQYNIFLSSILPENINYSLHIDATSPNITLDINKLKDDSYLKSVLDEFGGTFYLNISILIDDNNPLSKVIDINEINEKIIDYSFKEFENSKLQCTVATSIADVKKYPAYVLWELYQYGEKEENLKIIRVTDFNY